MAARRTGVRAENAAALERLKARVEGVSEKSLRRATGRAIASVRRKFEPEAKRTIRDAYNVPAGELSGKFKVYSGEDAGGEYLELGASTRGVPLIRFGARWAGVARRRGGWTQSATAQVLKGQGKTYGSAFIATVRGRKGVYARQFSRDSSSPSGRDPRNKLRHLQGPSPAQMTQGLGMANARRISSVMNSYLRSEIKRQLDLARSGK